MNVPESDIHCNRTDSLPVAVVGGGPAGLMAAEVLSGLGHRVEVFDAMPSVGRKFLLAGRGGLNLTHAEPMSSFQSRYSTGTRELAPLLADFDNQAVRGWALGLGQSTFVGSSGRVFPVGMKASPLLRAWLRRLQQPVEGLPVRFHLRHRWVGWREDEWLFETPDGQKAFVFGAVVLALGGGSWSRLGSNGAWTKLLETRSVTVNPLLPSNCGFDVAHPWSDHFRLRYAGQPLKSVVITVMGPPDSPAAPLFSRKGECVATDTGLEGSLIYAASAVLRDEVASRGVATACVDLLPDHTFERVLRDVSHPRGARSLSTHLKSRLGLDGIKLGLLYECLAPAVLKDPHALACAIKALPIQLGAPRPLDEAISTAGGVAWKCLDERGMLRALPGTFCAGEMLDWDAPTGGYLLTACLASGRWAGLAAHAYLEARTTV